MGTFPCSQKSGPLISPGLRHHFVLRIFSPRLADNFPLPVHTVPISLEPDPARRLIPAAFARFFDPELAGGSRISDLCISAAKFFGMMILRRIVCAKALRTREFLAETGEGWGHPFFHRQVVWPFRKFCRPKAHIRVDATTRRGDMVAVFATACKPRGPVSQVTRISVS